MALWNKDNIMLTTKGARILSKVQSGQGYLTITRAVASSQTVIADNLFEVEALNPENLELAIIGRRESGDGGSIILLQLSNLNLEQSFQLNEIGIFATHSEDPEDEFLYIIAQVDTGTGDRVPSYDITPVTATYDFYLYNLKSGDVTFEVSATGLATVAQLNDAVSRLEEKDEELEAKIDANTEAISQLDTQGINSAITALNIPLIRNRVSQLERNQLEINLRLKAEGFFPDADLILAEDFAGDSDQIDQLKIKVTSAAAGDDSIDLSTLDGIVIGSWYWITDGIKDEYVQVKSCIHSGNVYRIILEGNLSNTYDLGSAYLYRTTAFLEQGSAYGSSDKKTLSYKPSLKWQGALGRSSALLNLETDIENEGSFYRYELASMNGDGFITIDTDTFSRADLTERLKGVDG